MEPVHNDQGFTVVELLVALSIVALVATALIGVFDIGRRMFASVGETERELEEVTLLRRLLNESLGQAMSHSTDEAAVIGDARSVSIRSQGPRVLAFTTPVTMILRPDADQRGLVALWTSRSQARDAAPLSRRIVHPARRVQFAFFAPGAGWLDVWSTSAVLPALVRVTISGDAGVLEMMFATRRLANARCDGGAARRSCGGVR
jgi:prepilin-type N-terminal cleavage/methylation domain-containing protein